MCDKSSEAVKFINDNIKKTRLQENAIVSNKDYMVFLKELKDKNEKFDIIFLDPPYELDIAKDAVKLILEYSLLKTDGRIIIETDQKEREINNIEKMNVEIYDTRKYGRANLIFMVERGQTMEIFTLLENIEDVLEKSKGVPFSNKVLVDKEEILEQISELRLKLPEELKQAKWIKEERQRILVEAQKEADDIVKEAENRIISMIDEHEITKKAYEKKAEIIETANEMSREISKGTKDYADNVLNGIEVALQEALKIIQNNRNELK